MAAPAINDHISELAVVMKTVYGEGIKNQQNMAAMLYKRFGESGQKFGGNCYEFPARMVNTQSIGARPYRVSLPEPIMNQDVTARVRHKFIYGTFDITGPDIEKGKGNVNAFVNTQTDKMRSLGEMVLKDLNMQTYLDGTGVRATITNVTTTSIITVDTIKYLRVGMHINFVDATDGSSLIGDANADEDSGDTSGTYQNKRYTIASILPTGGAAGAPAVTVSRAAGLVTNATGTIATPAAVAAGDFLVRHKTVGSELTGLNAIVDDGTWNPAANILQDIDRTASPLWRAKVLEANGGDLTLQLMQIAIDIPEIVSGRRIDMIVGSYNARDRYLQLLVPQKRFTNLDMDGGFQKLEYNGRDFLVDVDCQDSAVYFLNKDSIKKFGLFDLQFVEQTGGILKHDSLTAGDVFYGFMRAICNFGTDQANANSKIVELVVDSNYQVAA